jgi:hypothetical protein
MQDRDAGVEARALRRELRQNLVAAFGASDDLTKRGVRLFTWIAARRVRAVLDAKKKAITRTDLADRLREIKNAAEMARRRLRDTSTAHALFFHFSPGKSASEVMETLEFLTNRASEAIDVLSLTGRRGSKTTLDLYEIRPRTLLCVYISALWKRMKGRKPGHTNKHYHQALEWAWLIADREYTAEPQDWQRQARRATGRGWDDGDSRGFGTLGARRMDADELVVTIFGPAEPINDGAGREARRALVARWRRRAARHQGRTPVHR